MFHQNQTRHSTYTYTVTLEKIKTLFSSNPVGGMRIQLLLVAGILLMLSGYILCTRTPLISSLNILYDCLIDRTNYKLGHVYKLPVRMSTSAIYNTTYETVVCQIISSNNFGIQYMDHTTYDTCIYCSTFT